MRIFPIHFLSSLIFCALLAFFSILIPDIDMDIARLRIAKCIIPRCHITIECLIKMLKKQTCD